MSKNLFIKSALIESGITLQEAASKLGITKEYLSRIVAGKSRPSEKLAYKMRDVFNIDIAHLTQSSIKCPFCRKPLKREKYEKREKDLLQSV